MNYGIYVGVVRDRALRGIQMAVTAPSTSQTLWVDRPDAELYVGVFQGEYENCLRRAVDKAETITDNVRLAQLMVQ